MTISEREQSFILEYGRQACEMFPDRQWEQVGPFLRNLWEQNQTAPWSEVESLMREAWGMFCGGRLADSDLKP